MDENSQQDIEDKDIKDKSDNVICQTIWLDISY